MSGPTCAYCGRTAGARDTCDGCGAAKPEEPKSVPLQYPQETRIKIDGRWYLEAEVTEQLLLTMIREQERTNGRR